MLILSPIRNIKVLQNKKEQQQSSKTLGLMQEAIGAIIGK